MNTNSDTLSQKAIAGYSGSYSWRFKTMLNTRGDRSMREESRRTGVWRLPDRCPPGFPQWNSIIPTTTTSNSPTLSLSVPAASDARQPSCLLPTFSFTHGDRRALKRRADHAKWRHLSYKLRRKPTPSSRGCSRAIPGQIADAFHSVERQGVSQPAGHAVMSRSSSLYRTISLQFHVRLRPAERVTAVRAW